MRSYNAPADGRHSSPLTAQFPRRTFGKAGLRRPTAASDEEEVVVVSGGRQGEGAGPEAARAAHLSGLLVPTDPVQLAAPTPVQELKREVGTRQLGKQDTHGVRNATGFDYQTR